MKIKTLLASTILLLAVAACSGTGGGSAAPRAATGSTTPTTSSVPSTSASDTAVHVRDFSLDPKDVTVQGTVSLAVTNDGPTIHNVSIRDASGNVVGATKDLKPGQSETLTVGIPAGSYILFCSLPGHESLGIKGTLTVTK
jgi:uncharacterized cupredoxin-like copper-binding protein